MTDGGLNECKEEVVGFVEQLCGEGGYVYGLHLSEKGAGVFADGLKQAVDSRLSNVHYLN